MEEHIPSIVNGYKPGEGHVGLDIIAEIGTPVLAVAPGTVVLSDFEPMFGNRVEILHGENEKGEWVKSRYLHLQKRMAVPGDEVMRGQVIGSLGRSGLLAGALLVFLTSMKELPAALILSPMGYTTMSSQVWTNINEAFFARAAAPALLLLLLASLPLALMTLRDSQ